MNGTASDFEYWSLAKQGDQFGHITRPVHAEGARDLIRTDEFTTIVAAQFTVAAADWLTGDAPFTAKLHPDYAPYGDYDQLMRLEEWYGR